MIVHVCARVRACVHGGGRAISPPAVWSRKGGGEDIEKVRDGDGGGNSNSGGRGDGEQQCSNSANVIAAGENGNESKWQRERERERKRERSTHPAHISDYLRVDCGCCSANRGWLLFPSKHSRHHHAAIIIIRRTQK